MGGWVDGLGGGGANPGEGVKSQSARYVDARSIRLGPLQFPCSVASCGQSGW